MTREEQIKEAVLKAKAEHIGHDDMVTHVFIDNTYQADKTLSAFVMLKLEQLKKEIEKLKKDFGL